MNKIKLFVSILILGIMTTACNGISSDTIIKVNGENITEQQFNKEFKDASDNPMFKQLGIDFEKDTNSFLYLMLKDKVVSQLIIGTLLDQEIEKKKITVSKEELEKEINTMSEKFGSREKFEEVLKQNEVSIKEFKENLKDELLIKKYIESSTIVSIGESEAKKFYDNNLKSFDQPEKVRASHILVIANPDQIKQEIKSKKENSKLSEDEINTRVDAKMQEKRAKAEKLLAKLKNDSSKFAQVAKENSEDAMTAKLGGDLGFFAEKDMVEEFSKVAFSIKPNTLSEIVQTPYGYHIIMVTDRVASGVEPFEKVKNDIIAYLESQKKMEILQNTIDKLKQEAQIEYINDDYNPETIQKAIKEAAKNNPQLMQGMPVAKDEAVQ